VLASIDVGLVHLKKRELFATVMPSKIFEAAAMAKPIILGLEGHAADLVKQAGCGICIEPENEAELMAALERLADTPALGAALGRAGRDYFVSRFDGAALAADYLELIRRVHEQGATVVAGVRSDEAIEGAVPPAPRSRELTLVPAGRDAGREKAPRVAGRA
jgi:glycosyltransferase involved in cell wall biosynthesis